MRNYLAANDRMFAPPWSTFPLDAVKRARSRRTYRAKPSLQGLEQHLHKQGYVDEAGVLVLAHRRRFPSPFAQTVKGGKGVQYVLVRRACNLLAYTHQRVTVCRIFGAARDVKVAGDPNFAAIAAASSQSSIGSHASALSVPPCTRSSAHSTPYISPPQSRLGGVPKTSRGTGYGKHHKPQSALSRDSRAADSGVDIPEYLEEKPWVCRLRDAKMSLFHVASRKDRRI